MFWEALAISFIIEVDGHPMILKPASGIWCFTVP